MPQRKNKGWQMRERLAQLAAEYMAETGSQDFQLAKNKALSQLGVTELANLPSNKEIHQALVAYQSIFRAQSQPAQLKKHRRTALDAMHFFEKFNRVIASSAATRSGRVRDYRLSWHGDIIVLQAVSKSVWVDTDRRMSRYS